MEQSSTSFNKAETKSLLLLSVVFFFRMLGVFVVLPIFSFYAFQLESATPFLVGMGFGAYGLTQAIFQIPLGLLSDIIGRKPVIILGLFVFALGCLLSALSDSIYTMIAGRFLQGVGALSSALTAFLADQVREKLHTRAMAFIGMSVGLAFALGFLFAPFLAELVGFRGIFFGLSAVSMLNIFIVLSIKINKNTATRGTSSISMFWQQLRSGKLNLVFISAFSVSFGLSLFMFHLPLLLRDVNVARGDFWKYYLLLLVIGFFMMAFAAVVAEKYKKLKKVMLTGACIILVSALFALILSQIVKDSLYYWLLLLACYVFFAGFNIFEPILPSLAIKLGGSQNRGIVSAGLNFYQFIGSFAGATLAGLFYSSLEFLPFLGLLGLGVLMLTAILKGNDKIFNTT